MHKAQLMLAFAALTVLAGCRTAPERMEREPAPAPLAPPPAAIEPAAPVDEAFEPGPESYDAPQSSAQVELGSGVFFDRNAAGRAVVAPGGAGEVTFNWENVPVQEVVKAILGDLMQENYVIAPGVQGSVTFATSKPISADQALGVLEMVLAWNGAAIVHKDGRYTVLPLAQALPGNLTPRIGPPSLARGYEVRVVPLQYVSPTEMQKILTPYVRQGAIISADNARGMIVIAGNAAELRNYLDTIEVFDVNWLKGMSVGIFPLERVDAKEIVPELDKIFGEGAGTPMAGMFRFLPIERMNAVLVITPQPEYLAEAEKWLGRLDRGGSEAGSQLYVYYVKNVKATDLAEKLTEVFTGGTTTTRTTTASVGAVVPGVESVEISSLNNPTREAREIAETRTETTTDAAPALPQPSFAPQGEGIAIVESENIKITAIEESNALMIRATASEYDSIQQAIERLDIVPLQVVIETKILQVDLTNQLSFGVRWFFENATSGEAANAYRRGVRGYGTANEGRNAWNSFAGSISETGALSWTFLNTSAEAIVSAIQDEGRVEVLSAPSLVVLNNKEANINVGTQIPVVSTFFSGTGVGDPSQPGTVTPGLNQSYVQFRDTGVILSVTPRVNPGGLVFLEVKQEKSTPGPASAAVAGNVPVNKSTIETEIAVQSGDTVMLGGLINDENTEGQGGVPGLAKIPIIGRLFGSTTTNRNRKELLVLITPTVIESSDQARQATDLYRENFRGLKPLLLREVDAAPGLPRTLPPPENGPEINALDPEE